MGGVIGGGLHQSRNPCDAGEPSGAIKKKKNKKGRKSSSVLYSDAARSTRLAIFAYFCLHDFDEILHTCSLLDSPQVFVSFFSIRRFFLELS